MVKRSYFSGFELLAVLFGRESHGLHRLVAQLQAELDSLVECLHGLQRRIDISDVLGLNKSVLVVYVSFDDSVSDCLF